MAKETLTLAEEINRAKEQNGRNQNWIVAQMVKKGFPLTSVTFSRKKKGFDLFTDDELKALEVILETKFLKTKTQQ